MFINGKEVIQSKITYPILGYFEDNSISNYVILFTDLVTGTVISENPTKQKYPDDIKYAIGYHSDDWDHDWIPYTGKITLQNEED